MREKVETNNAAISAYVQHGSYGTIYPVEGELTTERGINLNTPGDSGSQLNAASASFSLVDDWRDFDSTQTLTDYAYHTPGTSFIQPGNYVKAHVDIDGIPVDLFKGFVDEISTSLHDPVIDVNALDPVDALDRTFSCPAMVAMAPIGGPETWAGEMDEHLGNWDKRMFVSPATGYVSRGYPANFRSTLNTNLTVQVPVQRALRVADIGYFPPLKPGWTIASVPFESLQHLNPEMGAYIKRYTDRTITYGLTFNGWDKMNTQTFDLFFRIRADGSKLTFQRAPEADGSSPFRISVYYDSAAGGFRMINENTGASQVLTGTQTNDIDMEHNLILAFRRTASGVTNFRLRQRVYDLTFENNYIETANISAGSCPPPANFKANSSAPPFTTTDALTGEVVAGVFEIVFTKAPSTTDLRSWLFGGFMINRRDQGNAALTAGDTITDTWKPNCVFVFLGLGDAVTPRFERVKIRDMFEEYCKARCAAVWRDLKGRLWLRHFDYFRDRSSVENDDFRIIKTDADWFADSLKWEKKKEEKKASVSVKYRKPVVSQSFNISPSIIVANSQNMTTIAPGDTYHWTFKPPENEDWVGLCYLNSAGQTASGNFMYVDDVAVRTTVTVKKNDSRPSADPATLYQRMRVRNYRLGVNGIYIKASSGADVKVSFEGMLKSFDGDGGGFTQIPVHTPVVMAHTVINWGDAHRDFSIMPPDDNNPSDDAPLSPLPSISPGSMPDSPPEDISYGEFDDVGGGTGGLDAPDFDYFGSTPDGEYVHEGAWVYAGLPADQQKELFDYLKTQTSGEVAAARDVQIFPDTRIELGDAIKLQLAETGEEVMVGRVVWIKDSVSDGEWKQWVKIFPFVD